MLSTAEIQLILGLLAEKPVITPTKDFPFTVTKRATGYSDRPEISALQAKLSIMLQAATKR